MKYDIEYELSLIIFNIMTKMTSVFVKILYSIFKMNHKIIIFLLKIVL